MRSSSRSLKGAIRMRSRTLATTICLLAICFAARAQESADRQLVVSLNEGGFVAFQTETAWADARKAGAQFQRVPPILRADAQLDENHLIHRVLVDASGRFAFGYDLAVASIPASKQFKVTVLPLDQKFEKRLKAADPDHLTDVIPTFPKSAAPQTLDDGDAFSLDLLINQNAGVKIVDVVRVTFDKTRLRDLPRSLPRDFTLDAVELSIKDYRLLLNGSVVSVGKSTSPVAGALVWFYVQGRGRFIFSLAPRDGYEFQKVGIVDGNRIEFTMGGDRYEWLSASPILSGGGTWNLWVLHDPKYSPLFGAEKPQGPRTRALQKVDEAMAKVNANVNIPTQGGRSMVAPGKQISDTQKAEAVKPPRVMIGSADRIENLWPRN